VSPFATEPVLTRDVCIRGPLFAVAAGLVCALGAALVLIGWGLGVPVLTSILPGAAQMKPNTALCVLLLGVSLVALSPLRHPQTPGSATGALARVSAAAALAISTLTLFQYVTGVRLGIDLWMFRDALLATGSPMPGRMSLATALSAALLALSLLLIDARREALTRIGQWMALIATLIECVAALGYLYGAEQLYRIAPYSSVALHTALMMVLLGTATLFSRPDLHIARELYSRHLGGLMARRVLPLIVLLPVAAGWLRLAGQRAGWYETEVGLALFAVANVFVFSVVIWLAARLLNRVDAERRGADFRRWRSVRDAETRWRALVEASSQIVWTAGPDGVPDDSPSWRAFTGQSIEAWRGGRAYEVIHPEDREPLRVAWKQALATRTAFEKEYRLRHVSGAFRWASVRMVPIQRMETPDVSWVAMITDITERKQALALAHGQKSVLERIARGAPVAQTLEALTRLIEEQSDDMLCSILLLDADGQCLRHGAAPRLPEAYMKAIDGSSIGPAHGSCGTAAFLGRAVYVEDIAVDPLWENHRDAALSHGLRACWSTPIRDEGGRVLGTFAMYYRKPGLPAERHLRLIDLATHTAAICLGRHAQVQALRDSEQRFRQLAESLPQLVWTCDSSGACDFLSHQWQAYTGVPESEQLGFGWAERIHPSDRDAALAAWQSAVAMKSEYRIELRIRRHDGLYRWFDTRAVPLRAPDGRVVKWCGSNTDINDRKRAEESRPAGEAARAADRGSGPAAAVTAS